jgi:hypothetical protein
LAIRGAWTRYRPAPAVAAEVEPCRPSPKTLRQEAGPDRKAPVSLIPVRLRVAGVILRALFIAALVVVTVRVSAPQSETIWSAYETPGDLIRLALGFGVCLWIIVHLFMLPKDPEGYRTWVYLGLIVVPLAVLCAIFVW